MMQVGIYEAIQLFNSAASSLKLRMRTKISKLIEIIRNNVYERTHCYIVTILSKYVYVASKLTFTDQSNTFNSSGALSRILHFSFNFYMLILNAYVLTPYFGLKRKISAAQPYQ